ncbi:MAG: dockerin type I domain-containing protein [Sandaracinaceae bacterium]
MRKHRLMQLLLPATALLACAQEPDVDELLASFHHAAIVDGIETGRDRYELTAIGLVVEVDPSHPDHVESVCTGTRIASRTVLTAAHCVAASPERLRFIVNGSLETTAEGWRIPASCQEDPRYPWLCRVHRLDASDAHPTVVHSLYDASLPSPDRFHYDAALLRLAVTPYGAPIRVSTRNVPVGSELEVYGFGVSEPATRGGVGVRRAAVNTLVQRDARLFALTDLVDDRTVCNGDSGGPAILRARPISGSGALEMLVVGINVGADAECATGSLGVRADWLARWIAQNTADAYVGWHDGVAPADVNGDGVVDATDAQRVHGAVASDGGRLPFVTPAARFDVDDSGTLTPVDELLVHWVIAADAAEAAGRPAPRLDAPVCAYERPTCTTLAIASVVQPGLAPADASVGYATRFATQLSVTTSRGGRLDGVEILDHDTYELVGEGRTDIEASPPASRLTVVDLASLDVVPGHRYVVRGRLGACTASFPLYVLAPGDTNGDLEVDSTDVIEALEAGRYQRPEPASWTEGDWNGDGRFDSEDLVALLQDGRYDRGAYLPDGGGCRIAGRFGGP